MQPELQPVAFLEAQFGIIGGMAPHRADPALVRQDHGDRLALDERLAGDFNHRRRRTEFGPPRAQRTRSELLARLLQFVGDAVPAQRLVLQQRLDVLALLRQRLVLLADLHLLEPAQRAQPHVQDRLGLRVGQLEPLHQPGFGSSSLRMIRITSSTFR